jgi:hypothetical protein
LPVNIAPQTSSLWAWPVIVKLVFPTAVGVILVELVDRALLFIKSRVEMYFIKKRQCSSKKMKIIGKYSMKHV